MKYISVTLFGGDAQHVRIFRTEDDAIRHGYKECQRPEYQHNEMRCYIIKLSTADVIWEEEWGV